MGFGATVIISFVKEDSRDGKPYLTITMEDVVISNYSVGGNSGVDGKVVETLSVNFAKVEFLARSDADLSKSDRAELQMKNAPSAA